jgi:exopolysaccharide biosynthesis polyprenyl glycosylphosphotransferase
MNVSTRSETLPIAEQLKPREETRPRKFVFESVANLLPQDHFRAALCRERKRSERSRKHLLLMLIDFKSIPDGSATTATLERIARVLPVVIRETDIAGWFENSKVLGVIFTELGSMNADEAVKTIDSKVVKACARVCKGEQSKHLQISFYAFPDSWASEGDEESRHLTSPLYSDLFETEKRKKGDLLLKRMLDLGGSVLALLAFSPVFLILAAIIKFSSRGPVFFRQQRVGQYGKKFVFLKFRSMRTSSNDSIHKEYVKSFINGTAAKNGTEDNKGIFKITNDPRVTAIGRFIRRTSLDELPQFWNVLVGEMSLVGPRPPIPYEIEAYDIWHRRRLLEVKPGITGLWQVHGRSKTTFDEMVRLDLQYSRTWTPFLDLKILLDTPRAVLTGDGAC